MLVVDVTKTTLSTETLFTSSTWWANGAGGMCRSIQFPGWLLSLSGSRNK
jgi:hypothetical protein